jgi:multidrug efflux pump subunit AcrA (membrane-fusion protein)
LLGDLAVNLAGLEAARRTETLVKTQLLPQSELGLQSALAAYENGKAEFSMLLEAQRGIRKARQEILKIAGRGADASGRDRTHPGRRPVKTTTTVLMIVLRSVRSVRAATGWAPLAARISSAEAASARPPLPCRSSASCSTTATRWGWPTPHRRRRRTRWGWTTSRSTKAKTSRLAWREPASGNQVRISTEKIQKLGVRTEPAAMRLLGKTVRAAGRIEPDERRTFAVTAKFEGYVERLHVNATGQPVAKGQPLFEAYSPELVSAQREYAIAMQGLEAMKDAGTEAQAGMRQLADSSLARLRNWDLSPPQVTALMKSGQPQRTISFPSPVSGIVSEKKALQGMRFMPGEMLYQVTDLSSVWVIADLSEQDIGWSRAVRRRGSRPRRIPNEAFEGRITYIYPTLKAETRSIPVRVEMANPGQRSSRRCSPRWNFRVGGKSPVLTVPDSAVIDTGTRRIVLVQVKEGRFEPREVELGARATTTSRS